MKHAHILLLLPCGMLPPLAGAQRPAGSTSHRNNHPENKQTNQKQP